MNLIWLSFLTDYLTRLYLTQNRAKWARKNLLDLASVALPFLRPLRLIRLITLLTVLQRTTGEKLRHRLISYTIGSTILLVTISSLAVLETERDTPGANITTYPDALWWSFVTITTVGYGDHTPITPTGRIITAFLMVAGMALIGVITASLASWVTERANNDNQNVEDTTHTKLAELEALILEMREEMRVK